MAQGCDIQQPVPVKQFKDNIDSIANSMGLDTKCKSMMETKTNEMVSAGQADIGMGLIMQAQGGDTETSMDSLAMSEGCGSMFMNATDIISARNNINCVLNTFSNESATTAVAKATVRLKSDPIAAIELTKLAQASIDKLQDSLDKADANAMSVITLMFSMGQEVDPIKYIAQSKAAIERQLEVARKELSKIGNVTLLDSTIRATAGVKVKTVSVMEASTSSELQTEFNNIAKAAAENEITKKLGPNASDTSTKSAVQQRINQQENQTNQDITNVLNTTKVNVSADGEIEITAARDLLLKNVTLDASAEAQVMSEALMDAAASSGRKLASTLMTDALMKTDEQLEAEGVDLAALKKAQMDGVIGQLNALTDGPNSSMMLMVLGGIVGVFVLMKLGGGRGGGGGGGGTVVVAGGAKGGGGGGVFSIKSIQEEQNMRTAAFVAGAGVSFANSVAIVAMLGCDNVPKTKKYAIGLFEWMQLCLLVVDFGEFVPGVAKGEVKVSLLAPAALACLVLHVMMRVPYTLPLSVALGTFGMMGPEYVASVLKVIKSERCDTDKMKTLILGNTPAAAAGFMAVAYGLRWVG